MLRLRIEFLVSRPAAEGDVLFVTGVALSGFIGRQRIGQIHQARHAGHVADLYLDTRGAAAVCRPRRGGLDANRLLCAPFEMRTRQPGHGVGQGVLQFVKVDGLLRVRAAHCATERRQQPPRGAQRTLGGVGRRIAACGGGHIAARGDRCITAC